MNYSQDENEMPSAGSPEMVVPSWARQEEKDSKYGEAKKEVQANMDGLKEEIGLI